MKRITPWNLLYTFFLVLLAAAFLPKLFLADSTLYTEILTLKVILLIGTPAKLIFLFLGFIFARQCMTYFEEGNPSRPAWMMMTAGLLFFFLGQSVLAYYQLIRHVATPYPSLADLFFLLGTVFLVTALTLFILSYFRAGYPTGTRIETLITSVIAAGLLVGLVYGVLGPILGAPQPSTELFLNLAYPILDFLLLIPTFILLRVAFRLRGGKLWKVWIFILVGILCFLTGDILFAYFATLDKAFLDPILDLAFAYGYILVSRGVLYQLELLRE